MARPRTPTLLKPFSIVLGLVTGMAAGAVAAPLGAGLKSSGPGCPMSADAPEWRAVWLGHFSGGALVRGGGRYLSVDWRDEYVCFPSRASCEAWQRSMRRQYGRVEGYRACVIIRNGPLREWVRFVAEPFPERID